MRSLKFYTSLWAMMPHDQSGTILPYETICRMVAGAGYDGLALDLGAGDVAQAREIQPHMARAGLTPLLPAAAIALLTVAVNFVVDWFLHKTSGLRDEQ